MPPHRPRRTRRSGRVAAAVLVALTGTACADATPVEVTAPPTTTTTAPDLGVDASLLDGLRGVLPGAPTSASFAQRVRAADPTLRDQTGAAEAYDAVLLSAVAAEQARSDAPGRIAAALPSVSRQGTACSTFDDCRKLALDGTDLDYEGRSGAIELLDNGDPGEARFRRVRFGSDGSLRTEDEIVTQATPLAAPPAPADPSRGPAADGAVRIGTLLPVDGPSPEAARAALIGVRLAVDDVNAEGGALGTPVVLLADAGGDGSADAVKAATSRLVEERADVVVGGTDFGIDGVAVGPLVDAGIPMISPTDRNRGLSAVADRGLFLRTVAPEDVEGRVLASLPVDDGYAEIAVVAPSSGAEFELAADVTAALNAEEVSVVAAPVLDAGGSAAPAAAQVVESGADAVVLVLPLAETAALLRALADRSLAPADFPVYALSTAMNVELVRLIAAG